MLGRVAALLAVRSTVRVLQIGTSASRPPRPAFVKRRHVDTTAIAPKARPNSTMMSTAAGFSSTLALYWHW
ncbi:hypothetical protein CNX65_30955 [Actinosynnema pretiosum]|uniref:Uncharacterized protein n=1 Tax=Actinosynnema pretiosum TaxID=42197 RepID=A0A290ZDX1_9PSEU|nr:hypothetical protein CNX65_30955 [Actinosynnema pretiosum]